MRKLTFLAIIFLISLLWVSPVLADNDLHDKDGLMAESDGCAGCHRAHTALGPKLLKEGATQEQFCLTCHDGSGAETDVMNGEQLDGSSYGPDLSYLAAGTGANTATFTPDLPQAGDYDVYAWWTQHSNRASNALYTVYHSGGNETVLISQKDGGGVWTGTNRVDW